MVIELIDRVSRSPFQVKILVQFWCNCGAINIAPYGFYRQYGLFGHIKSHFCLFLDVLAPCRRFGRLPPQLLINGFRVRVPGRSLNMAGAKCCNPSRVCWESRLFFCGCFTGDGVRVPRRPPNGADYRSPHPVIVRLGIMNAVNALFGDEEHFLGAMETSLRYWNLFLLYW